jgi:hypothetical protein
LFIEKNGTGQFFVPGPFSFSAFRFSHGDNWLSLGDKKVEDIGFYRRKKSLKRCDYLSAYVLKNGRWFNEKDATIEIKASTTALKDETSKQKAQ